MKPRRVVVTLEIETDARLDLLRDKLAWNSIMRIAGHPGIRVEQVQANVVQHAKPAARLGYLRTKAKGAKR